MNNIVVPAIRIVSYLVLIDFIGRNNAVLDVDVDRFVKNLVNRLLTHTISRICVINTVRIDPARVDRAKTAATWLPSCR